jgi:hypothetical protein
MDLLRIKFNITIIVKYGWILGKNEFQRPEVFVVL